MTDSTLLHRQVNPSWIQEGRVTSQLFKPTPKDKKRLSVNDGDRITAEQAWDHHTSTLCLASVGVMSVTIGECGERGLPCICDSDDFPYHVSIDFNGCSGSEEKKHAKHLRALAVARDWQFYADSGE